MSARRDGAAVEVPGWEAAWEEALAGLREGGVPIGAALVRSADGAVLARGGNRRYQTGDVTAHAEIVVLRAAGPIPLRELRDTTMVTTAVPCVMCAGAIIHLGIPRVVAGLATVGGVGLPGGRLLEASGVEVVDLGREEVIGLMRAYVEAHPDDWMEDMGTALQGLDLTPHLPSAEGSLRRRTDGGAGGPAGRAPARRGRRRGPTG